MKVSIEKQSDGSFIAYNTTGDKVQLFGRELQFGSLKGVGGKAPDASAFIVGNSQKPKAHSSIRETYERFLKRHQLPAINFHGLHHTYATLLVESGGDIKTISTLLGHSKVSLTLDLYVHPSIDSKRKAVNKAFRKLKFNINKSD